MKRAMFRVALPSLILVVGLTAGCSESNAPPQASGQAPWEGGFNRDVAKPSPTGSGAASAKSVEAAAKETDDETVAETDPSSRPVRSAPIPSDAHPEAKNISKDFSELMQAMKDGESKKASHLVTESTHAWYEKGRRLALDSSGTDLEDLNLFLVVLVIELRYALSQQALSEMTGRTVFEWAIDEGLVGKDVMDKITIRYARLSVDGDVAYIPVRGGMILTFRREEDRWKMDMPHLMDEMVPIIEPILRRSQLTKAQFAINQVEETFGTTLPDQIKYRPLR